MTRVRATRDFPRVGVKAGTTGNIVRDCGNNFHEIQWYCQEQIPIALICMPEWFEKIDECKHDFSNNVACGWCGRVKYATLTGS